MGSSHCRVRLGHHGEKGVQLTVALGAISADSEQLLRLPEAAPAAPSSGSCEDSPTKFRPPFLPAGLDLNFP